MAAVFSFLAVSPTSGNPFGVGMDRLGNSVPPLPNFIEKLG